MLVQDCTEATIDPLLPVPEVQRVQLLAAMAKRMRAYGRIAHYPNFERAQRLYKAAMLPENCSGKLQVVKRYGLQVRKMSRADRFVSPVPFEAVVVLAVALQVPVSKLFKSACQLPDFKWNQTLASPKSMPTAATALTRSD
jgi:hypothetical protein